MNNSKLMTMFKSPFQPALKEGEYEVTMIKYTPVEPADATKSPYIKFELQTTDSTPRIINDNRFEKGFGVMISHLRQQLGKADETIVPQELCDEIIANATPFKIWVTKVNIAGIQRTNINYIKPLEPAKPNITVIEDDAVATNPLED